MGDWTEGSSADSGREGAQAGAVRAKPGQKQLGREVLQRAQQVRRPLHAHPPCQKQTVAGSPELRGPRGPFSSSPQVLLQSLQAGSQQGMFMWLWGQ